MAVNAHSGRGELHVLAVLGDRGTEQRELVVRRRRLVDNRLDERDDFGRQDPDGLGATELVPARLGGFVGPAEAVELPCFSV